MSWIFTVVPGLYRHSPNIRTLVMAGNAASTTPEERIWSPCITFAATPLRTPWFVPLFTMRKQPLFLSISTTMPSMNFVGVSSRSRV